MTSQNKGYAMVLLAGALWGTIGFFSTILTNMGMETGAVAFFRILSASIMLVPVLLIRGKGTSLFRMSKRGLLSCALVGLVSQAFFNICYMNAIEQGGMATAAVFLYTSPVYVAILSALLFHEPLTKNKIIAILINIAGCILTVTGGDFTAMKLSTLGLVAGLFAGLAYGLLPILSRTGADKEDPFAAAFYGMVFGTILLFFFIQPWKGIGTAFTPKMLLVLAGFGIIPSAMAYVSYYAGLSRITETSQVPVLASVETVVAAVVGLIAFGQSLGAGKIAGIALVLCSIALMNAKLKASR